MKNLKRFGLTSLTRSNETCTTRGHYNIGSRIPIWRKQNNIKHFRPQCVQRFSMSQGLKYWIKFYQMNKFSQAQKLGPLDSYIILTRRLLYKINSIKKYKFEFLNLYWYGNYSTLSNFANIIAIKFYYSVQKYILWLFFGWYFSYYF